MFFSALRSFSKRKLSIDMAVSRAVQLHSGADSFVGRS